MTTTQINNVSFAQSWQLDATGNWPGFRQLDVTTPANNLDQQRASNPANEIGVIAQRYGAVWAQPAYDRTGCMTTIPKGTTPTTAMTGVYDAWNRLVSSTDEDDHTTTYGYDGLNRRITVATEDQTRHCYYTTQWQNIEERVDSSTSADRQFVWGLRYIDNLVLRDRSVSGTLDERMYAVQDANWNTTAIVDTSGTVQERYRYTPYGMPKFMTASFAPSGWAGEYEWETLFCGYRWDADSGLYYVRRRYLNSLLGCWLTRDPIGYRDDISLYRYAISQPANGTDSTGLTFNQWCCERAKAAWRVGVYDAWSARPCIEEAWNISNAASPDVGVQNALRHCLIACCLTKKLGAKQAQQLLDTHEECYPGSPEDNATDLFNNDWGKKFAASATESCQESCTYLLDNDFLHTDNSMLPTKPTAAEWIVYNASRG